MAIFIAVGSFTDQGIRNIKDTTQRAAAAKEVAGRFGVTMKEIYWTIGQYDMVCVLEAQDDASVSAFGLSIAALGNVRFQTLRAFSAAEMGQVLAKMP
jgi:uncharacterized protein with GYD domain